MDYLDTPLIELAGKTGTGNWTIRHAVEGVQIFGGIGSGKTSGSGRMLALKYLKAGFGGLVLTVKPSEKDDWIKYCDLTGRRADLLIVEKGEHNYFNFLDYESQGEGETENVVQVLKTVIRAGEDKEGGGGGDAFWDTALDMLIFNVIDLCKLAYGTVSVQKMFDIVQSLPTKASLGNKDKEETAFAVAFKTASRKVEAQIDAWEKKQTADTLLQLHASNTYEDAYRADIAEARVLDFVDQFFFANFLNLAEKTRSIIDFSFSGFLFRLLRDPVYSLFCSHTSTFTPEDCGKGKIILINLPVKMHHKIGRDSQILFKYIWQRAMEKRTIEKNTPAVFLWADEAQNFLHEHDADFQATARSSRIATVYISQNLPNYLSNMGGARSDNRVKGFLGTLGTKIFHANADMETNRYASDLIGDTFFEETSRTATAAGEFSSSNTKSLKIDRIVRPEAFAQLKNGGEHNGMKVEGYMHVQGSPIKDGLNHARIQFDQDYMNPEKSNDNY